MLRADGHLSGSGSVSESVSKGDRDCDLDSDGKTLKIAHQPNRYVSF